MSKLHLQRVKVIRRSGPGGHLRGWCRLYMWGRRSHTKVCSCTFPGSIHVTKWCQACKGTGTIEVRMSWATIPRGWCGIDNDCDLHHHLWRVTHYMEIDPDLGATMERRRHQLRITWRGMPYSAEVVMLGGNPQPQHLPGKWHQEMTDGSTLCGTRSAKVSSYQDVVDCKRCRTHRRWIQLFGKDPPPPLKLVE